LQHLQEREEKIKTISKLSSSSLPSDLRSFRKTQRFRIHGEKELSESQMYCEIHNAGPFNQNSEQKIEHEN